MSTPSAPLPVAHIKFEPDAWRVYETLDMEFTNAGEHAYFHVEKVNLNTADVARMLSRACNVPLVQVGYAGLKDKHAVTRQWFSVTSPDDRWPLQHDAVRCLAVRRHIRKLRRGQHVGNRFILRLRMADENAAVAAAALDDWFPNRFGPQRVSTENVARALEWLEQGAWGAGQHIAKQRDRLSRRRRARGAGGRRGWHLSVLRSHLFNAVVQRRVSLGNYATALTGDVLDNGIPTGPLWGRGRSPVTDVAAEIEQAALAPLVEICERLEFAGVDQARRRLAVRPEAFSCEQSRQDGAGEMVVSFQLPPGSFATALLAHKLNVIDDSKKYE